jgi:hypothetical protein
VKLSILIGQAFFMKIGMRGTKRHSGTADGAVAGIMHNAVHSSKDRGSRDTG